jgi:hypothetical protein
VPRAESVAPREQEEEEEDEEGHEGEDEEGKELEAARAAAGGACCNLPCWGTSGAASSGLRPSTSLRLVNQSAPMVEEESLLPVAVVAGLALVVLVVLVVLVPVLDVVSVSVALLCAMTSRGLKMATRPSWKTLFVQSPTLRTTAGRRAVGLCATAPPTHAPWSARSLLWPLLLAPLVLLPLPMLQLVLLMPRKRDSTARSTRSVAGVASAPCR